MESLLSITNAETRTLSENQSNPGKIRERTFQDWENLAKKRGDLPLTKD